MCDTGMPATWPWSQLHLAGDRLEALGGRSLLEAESGGSWDSGPPSSGISATRVIHALTWCMSVVLRFFTGLSATPSV